MVETLFSYPAVLRRHREGPFAPERAEYLQRLTALGMARSTVLRHARYCRCVAAELQGRSLDHCFTEEEVETIAAGWAAGRVKQGRASGTRWPAEQFRSVATEFLRSLGRLRPAQIHAPGRHDAELAEFIAAQQEGRWQSEATCQSARWQITRFLDHLEQRGVALGDVAASDVDAFFEHMAQRWSRSSLHTSATMLRTWFGYCERRGWARAGLADAILLPRLYRHEGLPLGPMWDTVGRMLTETNGDAPASIRDHAIILLLSVYGLRSGEVRRVPPVSVRR